MFVVCCVLCNVVNVVCGSLFNGRAVFVVCWLLCVGCCVLFVEVGRLLCVVCCPLIVACCSSFDCLVCVTCFRCMCSVFFVCCYVFLV